MATKEKKPYENHRDRIRKRFMETESFDTFKDYEILELLLTFAIPRKDTKQIAKNLLAKFKSLNKVFEANPEELITVKGLGKISIAFLKMQHELFKAYTKSKINTKETMDENTIIENLRGFFVGCTKEALCMVCLDSDDRIQDISEIGSGIDSMHIDFRKIMTKLMKLDTKKVVFAHNHPNGILIPSQDDIEITKIFQKSLQQVEVKLVEHFIFTESGHIGILNTHSFQLR